VHPRDIFRFACLENASSLIVAHNHPSGDTRPSEQDLLFTRQLLRASRILQIPLLDHLILTTSGFSSFAREGWCQFESAQDYENVLFHSAGRPNDHK
jgi:DNA repair protein RadC